MGELVGSLNLLNERIDELADNPEGDATLAHFFSRNCVIYTRHSQARQHMVLNEYVGHFKRVSVPMLKIKLSNMSDKIVDYAGDEWNADDVVVLTEPSEYEGEFAHVDDARTCRAYTNGYTEHLVTVLETEFDDYFVEVVNGDIVAQDSNEIVYIDQGSEMGNYAWRDDTVYVEDVGDYYHTTDEGHYFFWDERNEEYVVSCRATKSRIPSGSVEHHRPFDYLHCWLRSKDDCVMSDYDLMMRMRLSGVVRMMVLCDDSLQVGQPCVWLLGDRSDQTVRQAHWRYPSCPHQRRILAELWWTHQLGRAR